MGVSIRFIILRTQIIKIDMEEPKVGWDNPWTIKIF